MKSFLNKTKQLQIFNSETLDYQKINFFKFLSMCISVTITLCILSYTIGTIIPNQKIKKIFISDEIIINQKYNEPFNEKALISLMNKLNIKHIDIVLKQAKIESSHYKSKVFIENNNLFGMRYPKNRITTATGENLKHATYDTWQESVIDYAIYQSTYLRNYSKNEYLMYLKNNYAESNSYVSLINKMK